MAVYLRLQGYHALVEEAGGRTAVEEPRLNKPVGNSVDTQFLLLLLLLLLSVLITMITITTFITCITLYYCDDARILASMCATEARDLSTGVHSLLL